jgi:phage-related protein
VHNCIRQLYSLCLTHIELLVPLVQLRLKVVDVVMRHSQLVLSVLQSCMSIIKEVGLEIMAVISPHQLVVQLLDTCLKVVALLKELLVALLNVYDEAVLGRHLVVVLLQA